MADETNDKINDREIDDLVKVWEDFVKLQESNKEKEPFVLNPNKERVRMLAKGVLLNRNKHGVGFCPCKALSGDLKQDLKLVCPCHFQVQESWEGRGECWCSLFVKKV